METKTMNKEYVVTLTGGAEITIGEPCCSCKHHTAADGYEMACGECKHFYADMYEANEEDDSGNQ